MVIPALQLGELRSQPITLQVVQSDEQEPANSLAPVFIETSLDQDSGPCTSTIRCRCMTTAA